MSRLSVVAARFRALVRREAPALRQALGALMFSIVAALVAGLTLGAITDTLERLPGLLVLVPAAVALRGNIAGALASRLATSMHAGLYAPTLRRASLVGQNLAAALALSLGISMALAVFAKGVAIAFSVEDAISIADFVVVSVLGGILASFVVTTLTVWIADMSARREWDLDNVAAPIVQSAGDLVTLPSLFLASLLADRSWVTAVVALGCTVAAGIAIVNAVRSDLDILRRVTRESIPILLFSGIVSIAAGVTIEKRLDAFTALPAVLVLIPPFLGSGGAIGGIFSSRVATKLHLGLLDPSRPRLVSIAEDLTLVGLVALPVFVLLGITADALGTATGLASPGMADMVQAALIGGLMATVALLVVGYSAMVGAFRFGLDPDNYAVPVVSAAMDLLGAFAIIFALVTVGII